MLHLSRSSFEAERNIWNPEEFPECRRAISVPLKFGVVWSAPVWEPVTCYNQSQSINLYLYQSLFIYENFLLSYWCEQFIGAPENKAGTISSSAMCCPFRWNLAWYVSAWLASWFVIKAEKDYLLTGGNNCFIEAPDNKARKFIELSVAQPRVGPISLKFGLIRECMTGLVVRY